VAGGSLRKLDFDANGVDRNPRDRLLRNRDERNPGIVEHDFEGRPRANLEIQAGTAA
jgi:hypothetical protein